LNDDGTCELFEFKEELKDAALGEVGQGYEDWRIFSLNFSHHI